MKKTIMISMLSGSLFLCQCAEFSKKKNNDDATTVAVLLAISNNAVCPSGSAISANPSNGTRFDFTACSGPATTALKLAGFTAANVVLSSGIVGTSNTSTVYTDASRLSSTGGDKKATVQISYVLSASDSTIDVVMPSTIGLSGATFQISPTDIKKKSALGVTSTLGGKAGIWTTSLGQEKTLCLEIHNENGAHMFGWQGACSAVARGSYEFEEVAVSGYDFSGDRIGLKINKGTIKSLNIYSTKIGTAGAIR